MVVAFDEVQKTLNMLKGHRTDETISELLRRGHNKNSKYVEVQLNFN
jgi:hypothetical protein